MTFPWPNRIKRPQGSKANKSLNLTSTLFLFANVVTFTIIYRRSSSMVSSPLRIPIEQQQQQQQLGNKNYNNNAVVLVPPRSYNNEDDEDLPMIPSIAKITDDVNVNVESFSSSNKEHDVHYYSPNVTRAFQTLFEYTTTTKQQQQQQQQCHVAGGWIDVNCLDFVTDVAALRQSAQTIMSRNLQCGQPMVKQEIMIDYNITTTTTTANNNNNSNNNNISMFPDIQMCVWDYDLVSGYALDNFNWEKHLWPWVAQQFHHLEQELLLQSERGYDDNNNNNNNNKDTRSRQPQNHHHHHHHLAFLDVGANVGDWVTALRIVLPTQTPLFAIEGAPATGALAAANLRAAIEFVQRRDNNNIDDKTAAAAAGEKKGTTNNKKNTTPPPRVTTTTAATALLPFSLLSLRMLEAIRRNEPSVAHHGGGICFENTNGFAEGNIGAQGIDQSTVSYIGGGSGGKDQGAAAAAAAAALPEGKKEPCKPSMLAGATLFSHALQALIPLQYGFQPTTTKTKKESRYHGLKQQQDGNNKGAVAVAVDWPRIFIAKFDIQSSEFKAMSSAMEWLVKRPPCYLMVEAAKEPQVTAMVELLRDVGYDSLWHTYARTDFPPLGQPIWTSLDSTQKSLQDVVADAVKDFQSNDVYMDYIFGFRDRNACIRRLLE